MTKAVKNIYDKYILIELLLSKLGRFNGALLFSDKCIIFYIYLTRRFDEALHIYNKAI